MTTVESTDPGENVVTEDHRYSVSVAGVIVDDEGRALIIQRRDNGHWEPPGGILEHGETIEDGLRREVHEETGLNVAPVRLTGIYQNLPRHIIAVVFRCKMVGGRLRTNAEAKDFCWAEPSKVTDLMTEAYALRVLDAQADADVVAVREHDGVHLLRAT
jgi:8-oxo-dGTP diphosphatase